MSNLPIDIPIKTLEKFCLKWKVRELSFFGSVLREDFNDELSDLDILIEFLPNTSWGFEIAQIKTELELIFNRAVDLVSKKTTEKSRNPYRKQEILSSREVIYEQAA